MTLPTFLVIGAMKAGTSSLHRYLGSHPDVFMPSVKEPEYFLDGPARERGLDWYRGLFAGGAHAVARGESSTRYSKNPLFPGVAGRAARTIPEAKLVYLLRHPVERIRSHHRHAVAEWGHPPVLEQAFAANRGEYLVPSRYAHQIECWLEHFPREQLLVVTSEDLDRLPEDTLAAVFEFLGVDPGRRPVGADRRYNQGGDHRTETGTLRRLRALSAYGAVKERIPKGLRHAAWRAASRPAPRAETGTSTEFDAEVVDLLADDLERLGALLPGFHCWDLLDRSRPT